MEKAVTALILMVIKLIVACFPVWADAPPYQRAAPERPRKRGEDSRPLPFNPAVSSV